MKVKKIKVMIIAGGTGGHIFPALSVAKDLTEQGCEVHWLGSRIGLEKTIVHDKYPLHLIAVQQIRRHGFRAKLWAPLNLLRAGYQAYFVMQKVKPDVVIGMGGFAAGPGGIAARLINKPLIIHEQNALAGVTNRILANFATSVFQAYPGAFQKKIIAHTIGNPVRQEIANLEPPEQRYHKHSGPLRILILGGSQGARAINSLIVKTLQKFDSPTELSIWHQTGEKNYSEMQQLYSTLNMDVRVEPFIENMAEAYAWADLVICRAGALTVAEIAAAGVASLMIPFPFAVDDHQWHNAQYLANAEAAILLRENALDEQKLTDFLKKFIANRTELLSLAQRARRLAQLDATTQIVQKVKDVAYETGR